jgi:hypothetical protein
MTSSIIKYAAMTAAVSISVLSQHGSADTLQVLSLPAGYTSSSIELGVPFGGSLAKNPLSNSLYVASGNFGDQSILKLDLGLLTTSTVATGLGNIGGMACLANGDLIITENLTSDSIFRSRDLTADGDFQDAGEVTELIAPILTNPGDFTGAQVTIAPAGNAAGIPAGSVVIQTADGGTSSELLVITDPLGTPAYSPAGGAFFSGFTYNGGVAFTNAGHIIMGSSEFPNARILALVNANTDPDIDAGESNVIVPAAQLGNGLADLAVSAENQTYFTENSSDIRTFTLPGNLLTGSATPVVFAQTNGVYISAVRFDDPSKTFAAGSAVNTAKLFLGGYLTFPAATNLIVIEPSAVSAVPDWQMY